MAGYFNGSVYCVISDSANLDLPVTGWTLRFFVYPDTGITEPDFGYIYSHATAGGFASAIQVIRGGYGAQPLNTVRVIIDWAGGTLLDFTSTATLTSDTWNNVIVSYNGTNLYIAINGTVNTASPPSLGSITPAGEARIGYAVAGGTRNFPGAIAHAAKYDRSFSTTDLAAYSAVFFTPDFALNSLIWHIPMFQNQAHDKMNNVSASPASMAWVDHGPFVYPSKKTKLPFVPVVPEDDGISFAYFRSC